MILLALILRVAIATVPPVDFQTPDREEPGQFAVSIKRQAVDHIALQAIQVAEMAPINQDARRAAAQFLTSPLTLGGVELFGLDADTLARLVALTEQLRQPDGLASARHGITNSSLAYVASAERRTRLEIDGTARRHVWVVKLRLDWEDNEQFGILRRTVYMDNGMRVLKIVGDGEVVLAGE